MDVSNESLDLSNLIVMFEKVLQATNITKKSICASFVDLRTLLKDWSLPDDGECQPPTCTCFETRVNNDINIDAIARDIEDVVGNAQKLREERSSKTTKTSRSRFQPICTQTKTSILSPQMQIKPNKLPNNSTLSQGGQSSSRARPRPRPILQSHSNMTSSAKSSQTSLKLENVSSPTSRSSCTSNQRVTSYAIGRSRPSRPSGSGCSSSNRSNASLQSTYQKDYTPRTSPRISNNPSTAKFTAGLKNATSLTSSQNDEPVFATITMAQLDDLLNRVSIGGPSRQVAQHRPIDYTTSVPLPSIHSSQESYGKQLNDECLIHGKTISLKCKVSETRVAFREAIDRLGVPSELVKVLKPYHSFLDKLQHQEDKISKEKKVSNHFLDKINLMVKNGNKTHWSEAISEPSVYLFSEYSALFKESSKLTKLSTNNVLKLRVKMDTLEKSYRKCSSHDASFRSDNKTLQSDKFASSEKRNYADWALAGIWNELSTRPNGFCAMEEALCIRYNNMEQLISFQENMQHAQRLHYQNQTLELLRKDVLPHLSNLSPNEPAFFAVFKTVAALCDLQSLTLPILVKTPKTETITDTTANVCKK